MRRLLLYGSLALVLTACIRGPQLPPEEVLQNASRASQELESARFTAKGEIDSADDSALRITLDGTLQNGGRQSEFTATVNGNFSQGVASHAINGSFAVFVALEHELFLKLNALNIEPPHPLLQTQMLTNLTGRWWKMQEEEPLSPASSVTPDPSLLRAQAEIVHVSKSHGLKTLNGRTVYHYDVTVDKEKLAAFLAKLSEGSEEPVDADAVLRWISDYDPTGELWIDAENFMVHRLLWHVSRKEPEPLSGSVQVDFFDHNAAPQISPPAEFELFSPMLMLQGGTGLPPAFDPDLFDPASRDVSADEMPEYDEVWLDDPLSAPPDLPSS